MFGYWLMGRLLIASKPTSTMTMEMTMAVLGRRIKVSAIITVLFDFHNALIMQTLDTVLDDHISRLQPVQDDNLSSVAGPELYALLVNGGVSHDEYEVFAHLLHGRDH